MVGSTKSNCNLDMVARVPHDIFRMLLRYKDPHWEFARRGGMTPNTQTLEDIDIDAPHTAYSHTRGSITWADSHIVVAEWVNYNDYHLGTRVLSRFSVHHYATEASDDEDVADYKCTSKLAELPLPCEACGPGPEL